MADHHDGHVDHGEILMGCWDCASCGARRLRGDAYQCASCGAPRPEDVKFYLPTEAEVVRDAEGIRAAEQLEKEGINCNLTLLFGFGQAAACADAGVFLISPFVGRIMDWYKANTDLKIEVPADDPGVQSVSRIYNYYKSNGYQTVVMGASFRNIGEIESLAGCDRLTISPGLLEQLAADNSTLPQQLSAENPVSGDAKSSPSESDFRYQLNDDAMATEKLAEGIRNFVTDQIKLEQLISTR